MADAWTFLAVGDRTVVAATGAQVRVFRPGHDVLQLQSEGKVEWVTVSPDGRRALIFSDHGQRIEEWRADQGIVPFVRNLGNTVPRDRIGCGYLRARGDQLTLLSQGGLLRGIDERGTERFAANTRAPSAFYAREFVELPGERLALVGQYFGDAMDAVVTVSIEALLAGAEAVQDALRERTPVWDRTGEVSAGPCGAGAAVVMRVPDEVDEIIDEDDDPEDFLDVWTFKGLYVRDLESGELLERHAYTGRAGSGVPIVGSSEWIAVTVWGGIDLVERATSKVYEYRACAALDVRSRAVATFDEGEGVKIESIDELWQGVRTGAR